MVLPLYPFPPAWLLYTLWKATVCVARATPLVTVWVALSVSVDVDVTVAVRVKLVLVVVEVDVTVVLVVLVSASVKVGSGPRIQLQAELLAAPVGWLPPPLPGFFPLPLLCLLLICAPREKVVTVVVDDGTVMVEVAVIVASAGSVEAPDPVVTVAVSSGRVTMVDVTVIEDVVVGAPKME